MNEQELQDFLKKYGSPQRNVDRAITSRRYNLVVWRYKDGEKVVVETIEYLSRKAANDLKAEYIGEGEGFFCDIIEDVTTDRNGEEIIFEARKEIPEVHGKCHFYTPEATKLKIERDRAANREKAWFRKAQSNTKTTKYAPSSTGWADPKSSLHQMYLDAINKSGYKVYDRHTGEFLFTGLQKETAEFLFNLMKSGKITKNDLDISYVGE